MVQTRDQYVFCHAALLHFVRRLAAEAHGSGGGSSSGGSRDGSQRSGAAPMDASPDAGAPDAGH